MASSTFSRAEKPRQQVEGLKDVADPLGAETVALRLGHQRNVEVVDADLAAIRPADAGDDVQQRGLAAAAAADQHHLLAGGDVEFRNIEDRQRRAVGLDERFFDIAEVQHAGYYARDMPLVRQ